MYMYLHMYMYTQVLYKRYTVTVITAENCISFLKPTP